MKMWCVSNNDIKGDWVVISNIGLNLGYCWLLSYGCWGTFPQKLVSNQELALKVVEYDRSLIMGGIESVMVKAL